MTTICRHSANRKGTQALDLLVHQIDGDKVRSNELLFEPELVVRASTARALDRAPARG